jgi:hypothetical protein
VQCSAVWLISTDILKAFALFIQGNHMLHVLTYQKTNLHSVTWSESVSHEVININGSMLLANVPNKLTLAVTHITCSVGAWFESRL